MSRCEGCNGCISQWEPYPCRYCGYPNNKEGKQMNINFGKNLKAIREFLDLTQTELGNKCNLQPSAIAHFEAGRRKPSFDNIVALKKALGVSYERLLEGKRR